MEAADFSGYATKAGLKCSDGRTITADAFKHMDGVRVPLVWQHGHDKPDNVLGHGILEARADGMYVHGFFNSTKQGENAKLLVQHDDIKNLSIWANELIEKSKNVLHGKIKEVVVFINEFFQRDMLGHGRPCLAMSRTLHLPLLQIADQSRKCGRRNEPLIAGRPRNFFGVEKSTFAVAFDLSL